MADYIGNTKNLADLYDTISKNYLNVENSSEPSSSEFVQFMVTESIRMCLEAIAMVNELCLFGENEDIDELSSESIKFMVLPAYAGYFVCRVQSKERKKHVESSKEYFQNFLKLCSDYSVKRDSDGDASTGSIRDQKIRRLKNRKELEKRLGELQSYVEKDHVDEEVKREFYLNQVKRWMLIADEELDSAKQELQILSMMAKGDIPKLQPKDTKDSASFRPLLLTRTREQAKVFGAGYPSLPTYSVEEFYEMQLKGAIPPDSLQQGAANNGEVSETERQEKQEELEERDDPNYLREKRNWDEFKDDNRRGSGNRKNRG